MLFSDEVVRKRYLQQLLTTLSGTYSGFEFPPGLTRSRVLILGPINRTP